MSIGTNKRALNIKRTITAHQRSTDSSLSSDRSGGVAMQNNRFYDQFKEMKRSNNHLEGSKRYTVSNAYF